MESQSRDVARDAPACPGCPPCAPPHRHRPHAAPGGAAGSADARGLRPRARRLSSTHRAGRPTACWTVTSSRSPGTATSPTSVAISPSWLPSRAPSRASMARPASGAGCCRRPRTARCGRACPTARAASTSAGPSPRSAAWRAQASATFSPTAALTPTSIQACRGSRTAPSMRSPSRTTAAPSMSAAPSTTSAASPATTSPRSISPPAR